MKAFVKIEALREGGCSPKLTDMGMSLEVYSWSIAETGRHNSVLIPARTSRKVRTGFSLKISKEFFGLILPASPAKERLLFPGGANVWLPGQDIELSFELYNGGHDGQYVEHSLPIARIVLHPAIAMTFEDRSEKEESGNAFPSSDSV